MNGDLNNSCGQSGEICQICRGNTTCLDGACAIDPESLWNIVVINAEVMMSPPDGEWDTWGSDPDLYVEISVSWNDESEEWEVQERTSTKDDTLFTTWDETVISGVPARRILNGGIGVQLWDADLLYDQSIGSCGISINEADLGGPPRGSCGSFGDFEVTFQIVPY